MQNPTRIGPRPHYGPRVRFERLESISFVALRLLSGLMFATHGAQKLFGWFAAASQPAFGTQLWFGGLIELACGLLIAVGLFTRPVALLAAGTMAVAYFQFHFKLQLTGSRWVPVVNKGELAALYSLLFLFFAARGPGAWALDARVRRRHRK